MKILFLLLYFFFHHSSLFVSGAVYVCGLLGRSRVGDTFSLDSEGYIYVYCDLFHVVKLLLNLWELSQRSFLDMDMSSRSIWLWKHESRRETRFEMFGARRQFMEHSSNNQQMKNSLFKSA